MKAAARLAAWALALGLATLTGGARAAGPHELVAEAAARGKLGPEDVGTLELGESTCLLGSKAQRLLFCLGYTRGEDGGERWDGLIVGARGVEFSRAVLARGADDDVATDDRGGRAALNKALAKVRWDEEVAWSHFYELRGGKVGPATDAPNFTTPAGRDADITSAGVRVSDGTTLALGPVPDRVLTRVWIFALPGTSGFVALANDAKADRRDSPSETRVAVSAAPAGPERSPTGPASGPAAPAACPHGGWCPPGYAALYPHLERFCAESWDGTDLAAVRDLAARGELSDEDLSVLFNTYGALYAYAFKQKRDYNAFFYGAGLDEASARDKAWLPPSCRTAIGRFTSDKMPPRLRQARDDVKALWQRHKAP